MTFLVAEWDLKGGYPDISVQGSFLYSSNFYQMTQEEFNSDSACMLLHTIFLCLS